MATKKKGELATGPGSWCRVSLFLRRWQVDELVKEAKRRKLKGAASVVTVTLYKAYPPLAHGEQLDLMGTAPAFPPAQKRARKKAPAPK